ncbi:MAG TPA: PAS domain S-box protein [Thermoleophilaceae bacterium]
MAAPLAMLADRAVAHVMAVTDDEELLFAGVLEAMGKALACRFGAVWEPEPDGARIACVETWCADGFDAEQFDAATRTYRFEPGTGLPGRVWAAGHPEWIVDLADDPNFPRAEAAVAAGLVTAFCFPLHSPRGVLGAVELYATDPRIPDPELLATMESMGAQLGQFLVRRRAERSVRESDARKSAIMAAALDCVITIDHRGNVLEFNRAAEKTFGYTAEEAVGREMAELIVPPALRERHRNGLVRYLETEQEKVLGRRIEITGMRKDGSEFPVELAITRIDLPGEPMFTGHLRDITDRKRTESELRASRARIVAAADAERRRIERDLHDGAQQRLVNLGLTLQIARSRLVSSQTEPALEVLDEAIIELTGATAELRELARGIHPAVLSDGGLSPALSALVERAQPRARLRAAPSERMLPEVEATAYFLVAEALTNATRHAAGTLLEVTAEVRDGDLYVEVRDDGVGGANANGGSGLRGLFDRVAAIGGELEIVSPPGEGTTVRARIPCEC